MNIQFLMVKLGRAVWVALIEEKRIEEAWRCFLGYINNLKAFAGGNKKFQQLVQDEITYSEKLFSEKVLKLANASFNDKNYSDAIICYGLYFRFNMYNTDMIKNYITTLAELKQTDLELDIKNSLPYIGMDNDPQLCKLFAEAHADKNEPQKAIEYFEKYRATCNGTETADDYNSLGCYYNKLYEVTHNPNDAMVSMNAFSKAYEINPNEPIFARNEAIVSLKINDFERAGKAWKRVLALNNLTNNDKFDYAAYCLKSKSFEEWYKYNDSRFLKDKDPVKIPYIAKPCWDGTQDISDKTLLVFYEQGFGDMILTYGYVPRLQKLAKRVMCVVQNTIYPLLKDNEFGIEVFPSTVANDLSKLNFDYYIPSMSIPVALKLKDKNLSVGGGYIKADKNLVAEYRQKYFNNNKYKIGIALIGCKDGDKTRDADVSSFLPLSNLPNVKLYCLSKGLSSEDNTILKRKNVTLLGETFEDFSKTAAAIENCDLIVSTDNCVMNLAGAMGKRTFCLFNSTYPFRWFDLTGDDVVWYTSVKPFVNKTYGKWDDSINKIVEIIQNEHNKM